ncbi:MAG: hypothetical protein JSR60_13220 [Proteobacteria bacterium]|nr:hypothetical protein [Pseudomonadota bacterium]
MTDEDVPFERLFDLRDLGRAGAELRIEADEAQRARIAAWADIAAVKSFAADVTLRRHSASNFSLDADLVAEIVQQCVVTLAPVESRIALPIHRQMHLTQNLRHRGEVIELADGAGDDDAPEEIDSLDYDLAAPLLEEFALAIDPYPRASGVEFAAPEEAQPKPESPFAVLKALKDRG